MKGTREFVLSGKGVDAGKAAIFAKALDQSRDNLVRAWKAGVPLVMGTDAGNPLVFPVPRCTVSYSSGYRREFPRR